MSFRDKFEKHPLIVVIAFLASVVTIVSFVFFVIDRYKQGSETESKVIFSNLQTYREGSTFVFRYGYSTDGGTVTEVYTKVQVNAMVAASGSNEEFRYDWVKGPYPSSKSGEIVYTTPDDWWTPGGVYSWVLTVVADGQEFTSEQSFRYPY